MSPGPASPSLALKVPPPVVALVFAAVMWVLSRLVVTAQTSVPNRTVLVIGLVLIGVLFGFSAMGAFLRARTTMNPTKPETTSTLVTRGVFRITRNPMYVSLVFYLAAWCVYLSNWVAPLLLPVFVLYIDRYQIKPEERALMERYGPEFAAYKARVRRWL